MNMTYKYSSVTSTYEMIPHVPYCIGSVLVAAADVVIYFISYLMSDHTKNNNSVR